NVRAMSSNRMKRLGLAALVAATSMATTNSLPLSLAGVTIAASSVDTTGNIMDMAYPCGLTNPAFCDNFTEKASTSGSREGALDPTKWDYTRVSQSVNAGQGQLNEFSPTDAQHCKTLLHNVIPYNDSFFCGLEVPEPQHWMEAFNDAGQVVIS